MVYCSKLEENKRQVYCVDMLCFLELHNLERRFNFFFNLSLWQEQCISTLVRKNGNFQCARNTKKLLNRMHDNIIFCLENLGLWGALQVRKNN